MKNSINEGQSELSTQSEEKIIKDTKGQGTSASITSLIKNEPLNSENTEISQDILLKQTQSVPSKQSPNSEVATSSSSENDDDTNGPTLREMFPDLPITDENLSLMRLQQMSTTDVTRQIVSLNKPAILKPAVRLIPPDKTWLSALPEVDQGLEAEEEQEIREWTSVFDNETDSESNDEVDKHVDQNEGESSTKQQ